MEMLFNLAGWIFAIILNVALLALGVLMMFVICRRFRRPKDPPKPKRGCRYRIVVATDGVTETFMNMEFLGHDESEDMRTRVTMGSYVAKHPDGRLVYLSLHSVILIEEMPTTQVGPI